MDITIDGCVVELHERADVALDAEPVVAGDTERVVVRSSPGARGQICFHAMDMNTYRLRKTPVNRPRVMTYQVPSWPKAGVW